MTDDMTSAAGSAAPVEFPQFDECIVRLTDPARHGVLLGGTASRMLGGPAAWREWRHCLAEVKRKGGFRGRNLMEAREPHLLAFDAAVRRLTASVWARMASGDTRLFGRLGTAAAPWSPIPISVAAKFQDQNKGAQRSSWIGGGLTFWDVHAHDVVGLPLDMALHVYGAGELATALQSDPFDQAGLLTCQLCRDWLRREVEAGRLVLVGGGDLSGPMRADLVRQPLPAVPPLPERAPAPATMQALAALPSVEAPPEPQIPEFARKVTSRYAESDYPLALNLIELRKRDEFPSDWAACLWVADLSNGVTVAGGGDQNSKAKRLQKMISAIRDNGKEPLPESSSGNTGI